MDVVPVVGFTYLLRKNAFKVLPSGRREYHEHSNTLSLLKLERIFSHPLSFETNVPQLRAPKHNTT